MYVYGQRTVSHVCTLVRNLVRGGGGGNLKQINTKSDSRVMLTKHFRLIRAKVIQKCRKLSLRSCILCVIVLRCHHQELKLKQIHQNVLKFWNLSKMSQKSSHSLTDQKYVNLVSWFHTWANTCLLYNTQWFNSNILIIIGPRIPISLHCNRRERGVVELLLLRRELPCAKLT